VPTGSGQLSPQDFLNQLNQQYAQYAASGQQGAGQFSIPSIPGVSPIDTSKMFTNMPVAPIEGQDYNSAYEQALTGQRQSITDEFTRAMQDVAGREQVGNQLVAQQGGQVSQIGQQTAGAIQNYAQAAQDAQAAAGMPATPGRGAIPAINPFMQAQTMTDAANQVDVGNLGLGVHELAARQGGQMQTLQSQALQNVAAQEAQFRGQQALQQQAQQAALQQAAAQAQVQAQLQAQQETVQGQQLGAQLGAWNSIYGQMRPATPTMPSPIESLQALQGAQQTGLAAPPPPAQDPNAFANALKYWQQHGAHASTMQDITLQYGPDIANQVRTRAQQAYPAKKK
jgi:hypothetical protein